MKKKAHVLATAAVLLCLVPASAFALLPYTQDFENLNQADTGALGADDWLVFANVFAPGGTYLYGYGVFPAPNDGGGFCQIAVGEGGAAQGFQQLVVFSDYNNADHANGNLIESLVFQEQLIGVGDETETWTFDFQAKLGNLEGNSTAQAFIKTLDPNSGYAQTNYIPLDMTNTSTNWSSYSISLTIQPGLAGQLLQFGFGCTATNYEGSGVFYDNIRFHRSGEVVPTEDTSWSEMKVRFQ